MVVFKVLMTVGLLAIGGILVMEQLMNIGQFVAAEIIILLIMSSIEKLIASLETIYDVLTGLEKVGEVTDLELEKTGGLDIEVECHSEGMQVDLVKLSFTYPESPKPTLNNLNLTIKRGSFVALVGPNGGGKSTLIRLLAGLYQLTDGQILYDEISRESFSADSLHSAIGDCLSMEQLFQGTVLENVTMGKERSLDEVKEVFRNLHLINFVSGRSNGFYSLIDPQGSGLAESTVQKLLIARAVILRPKLLLIEDNLDAIDEDEKNDIINYLSDKENKWTVVAVSRDESLISQSKVIVEMRRGQIAFTGDYTAYQKYRSDNA